jgi:asparagine synthetase B (glutamine-hydrolysing)
MLHAPDYRAVVIHVDDTVAVGYTGYPDYPVLAFDADGVLVVFEGWAYNRNRDLIRSQLQALARSLAQGRDAVGLLKNWTLSADGDYIGLVLDKQQQRGWLFNDPLGRLPIYLRRTKEHLLISREVKFCAGVAEDFRFGRQGIAEALVFGYPLGRNTLIEDVHRLDPGTLVQLNLANCDLGTEVLYQFNFDSLWDHPPASVGDYARLMADRFLMACRNLKTTFPNHAHLVSLSGGLDSRCVLAGMKRAGAPVQAFSFQDAGLSAHSRDAIYAEQVAKAIQVEWTLLERPPLSVEEIERLLWLKDGLNFSQVAFLLPLHRRLKETHRQPVLHLTGDNGDRSTDPQGASVPLAGSEDFMRFTIERHTRIPLDQVARVTGLGEAEIFEGIRQRLRQYPESAPQNQYRHFILAERLSNWNFQAEDRNRTYFWHATPFSSFPYFEAAMATPDSAKKHWRLVEQFMRLIDPRCVQVPYGNWAAPINSYHRYWIPFKRALYERLPTRLRIAVRDRTLYRGLRPAEHLRALLEVALNQLDDRAGFLDRSAVRDVASKCNLNEFHNILTVVAYLNLCARELSAWRQPKA